MNPHSKQTHYLRTAAVCFGVFALVLVLAHDAYGQAMSSSNFKIQSDSLNFGGARSGSAAYTIEDTLGESATGLSSSTNYALKAGYQQMQETVIAVVPPSNVTMSPAIAGVTGGTSNGATTFQVTTDDPAGYTATLVASGSPALVSGANSFADYTPTGANPDYTFGIAATDSEFGFTVEGTDIAQRYRDNGSLCNTGSGDTSLTCWDALSTSPITILNRTTPNHPNGIVTTLRFRASSGGSHIQVDGVYTATSTLTVIPL